MYVPRHFEESRIEVLYDLIRSHPLGALIVHGDQGLDASHVFEANKQRVPHITMLSQEEAHKAMPNLFKGADMPTLALVGAHQPRSMEAVLNVAKAARREGDLDGKLLNDVFWAVSSANDCFY